MKILLHKTFIKQHKKLRLMEKEKFKDRRNMFLVDSSNPVLNNHPLHGKYSEYRSINITGDIRVVHKVLNKDTVLFTDIGSHSELYS